MVSPPPSITELLVPPSTQYVVEGSPEAETDGNTLNVHSRTASGAVSYNESPPVTPRTPSFAHVTNSFSPLASVSSFPSSPDQTPLGSPGIQHRQSYFLEPATPRSGYNSVSTSVADLSRVSSAYFGSRPNTTDYGRSNRPLSRSSRNTFASPKPRPLTMHSSAATLTNKVQRERTKSTMLVAPESLVKPWIGQRDPYMRLAYWLTYGIMLLGVATGVIRCYTGWKGVALLDGNLCLVMDENFDSEESVFGPNGTFFREVDMSGFGNGEFEMTTASENNSYVQNGFLYITPTFTADSIGAAAVEDGYIYNITGCTFNITQGQTYTDSVSSSQPSNTSAIGPEQPFDLEGYTKACSAVSNATAGTIINPIQSARVNTRRTASIKYGKVEVRARNPTGDWLWPAIWMLPVENVYGEWPVSGEIDIMEARGNGFTYPNQGSNFVRSSLNWGPTQALNAVAKTFGWWESRRNGYDKGFHTYTMEWDEDFLRMSVDTRLFHMLEFKVKKSFWDFGEFPHIIQNGSETVILENPWSNGTKAAPFDQSFYLIMNVAVGGTNGWFPDGGGKPWFDGSATAMSDFWSNRAKWLPSWPTTKEDRSLVVDYVKMWQKC